MTDLARRATPFAHSPIVATRPDDGIAHAHAHAVALPPAFEPGMDLRRLAPPPVLELQEAAGNAAVTGLLQRQPTPDPKPAPTGGPKPGPTPGPGPNPTGGTGTPTGTTTPPVTTPPPDPLADSRIKWIEDLPTTLRLSIDSVGDSKLGNRIRALDASIARQQAVVDKAATKDAKEAATKAMESDADVKAKAELNRVQGNRWSTNRIAFMDYLGCSLGGDAGVERYYRAMVPFGTHELWVHPEVARRLIRVRDDLKAESIPMPETDVGFGLRGRHIHPAKEDMYPGMMIHSLGIAIDWEAYKNVHFKDEAEMALVDAVIGGSHSMQLPTRGLQTIVAMGEQAMGNTLTAQQQKDYANASTVIDTIGTEYDRLAKGSDDLRDSLTFDKDTLLALHHTLIDLQAPIPGLETRLTAAQRRKDKKDVPGAQKALDDAKKALADKMVEVKPQLQALFKPWTDALDKAIAATRKEAEPLLGGRPLEEVITDLGMESKRQGVATATKPAAGDLAKLLKDTKTTTTGTAAIRAKVASARAYLDTKGSDDEKAQWTAKLVDLEARAAKVIGRAAATQSEAQVLGGNAPVAAGALAAAKAKKPGNWDKDVAGWEADLVKLETAVGTGETALASASAKLTPEAIQQAHTFRDERAASEAIRSKVTKPQFAQLQALKVRLFNQKQASERLLNDASFMFKPQDVRNPGVAQLVGVLGQDPKKKVDLGGGGFFGTSTAGLEAIQKGKPTSRSGFGKRFFQVMAQYGFEPAATWHTADTMHFQVRGLVDQVMPADSCKEPPADAESKAKDQAALDAIAAARAKAARERAAGVAFSTGAETAHATWEREGSKR
jgi:hypothetical protein